MRTIPRNSAGKFAEIPNTAKQLAVKQPFQKTTAHHSLRFDDGNGGALYAARAIREKHRNKKNI